MSRIDIINDDIYSTIRKVEDKEINIEQLNIEELTFLLKVNIHFDWTGYHSLCDIKTELEGSGEFATSDYKLVTCLECFQLLIMQNVDPSQFITLMLAKKEASS